MQMSTMVIQECHTLYTDSEHGLVDIADTLGLKLLPPRKKITIMLIGRLWVEEGFNHLREIIPKASNPPPPTPPLN